MANTPVTTSFDTRHQQHFTMNLYDFNGIADTTTPISVVSDNTSVATVLMDSAGRGFTIVSAGAGTCTVTTSVGNQTNHVTVTVTTAPDLGHLDLISTPVSLKP